MMRNVKLLPLYQHSCHFNAIHTFIIYEALTDESSYTKYI